jgi:hypothetical protein
MAKFTAEEILMNRAKLADLPSQHSTNLSLLVSRLNSFFSGFNGPIKVSSGYRPPQLNSTVSGASPTSWHLVCAAADLRDIDSKVWQFCIGNLQMAKELGLWLEDKRWTPTWVHLQIYAPKSGKRIFVPNSKPAIAPELWSGTYNKAHD